MNLKNIVKKLRGEINLEQLKVNGLKVGEGFSYGSYCFLDPSFCFLIQIGNHVTFSTRVHVLAHDASTKKILGYSKVGRVMIGDGSFVGANVTILPGISIGSNSIIGAGSVVTKDIPENEVWAGNPARKIASLKEYSAKIINGKYKKYGEKYTIGCGITEEEKREMIHALDKSKWILVE